MDLLPHKQPSTNEALHLTLKHLPLPGPGVFKDLGGVEEDDSNDGANDEHDGATMADAPVTFSVAGSYKVCYKVAGAAEYQQVGSTLLTVSSSSSGSGSGSGSGAGSVDPKPPTSYTTNVKPRFGSKTFFTLAGGD